MIFIQIKQTVNILLPHSMLWCTCGSSNWWWLNVSTRQSSVLFPRVLIQWERFLKWQAPLGAMVKCRSGAAGCCRALQGAAGSSGLTCCCRPDVLLWLLRLSGVVIWQQEGSVWEISEFPRCHKNSLWSSLCFTPPPLLIHKHTRFFSPPLSGSCSPRPPTLLHLLYFSPFSHSVTILYFFSFSFPPSAVSD